MDQFFSKQKNENQVDFNEFLKNHALAQLGFEKESVQAKAVQLGYHFKDEDPNFYLFSPRNAQDVGFRSFEKPLNNFYTIQKSSYLDEEAAFEQFKLLLTNDKVEEKNKKIAKEKLEKQKKEIQEKFRNSKISKETFIEAYTEVLQQDSQIHSDVKFLAKQLADFLEIEMLPPEVKKQKEEEKFNDFERKQQEKSERLQHRNSLTRQLINKEISPEDFHQKFKESIKQDGFGEKVANKLADDTLQQAQNFPERALENLKLQDNLNNVTKTIMPVLLKTNFNFSFLNSNSGNSNEPNSNSLRFTDSEEEENVNSDDEDNDYRIM